jgi:hypothetical protein
MCGNNSNDNIELMNVIEMNKKFLLIAGLVLMSVLPVSAQYNRFFNKGDSKSRYGVQYVLPQTYVNLRVLSKKTAFTPGELCQYAERYLKLTDVPTNASTQWTFESAKMTLASRPDSTKVFFVPMNEKTTAPLMELTPEGIVKSINMTLPQATPALDETPVTVVKAKEQKEIDPHTLLSEEILMAGSTAKMAELVSKEIYNIRESRSDLVKGEADNLPKDGAQLKLMLDNLDAQEKALTSMFTGTYKTEEQSATIPFEISEMNDKVLFRFSSALGLVDKDDLSGRPFLLTIKKIEAVDLRAQDATDNKKKKEEDKNEGVAYNIPGHAQLILKDGNRQVAISDFLVTQFGSVEYLAPTLFTKKTMVSVRFDPFTGSLLKIDRTDTEK